MGVKGGNILYKISDLAKLLNVSVRTLRYYDEINIFKPIQTDLFTGYRYYDERQIKEFELLKLLQETGLSLEEIKTYKDNFNDNIMQKKKKDILKEINDLKDKIKKVDYLRGHSIDGKIMTRKEEIKILKTFRNTILRKQYEKQIDSEVQKGFTPVINGKPNVLTLYKKAS